MKTVFISYDADKGASIDQICNNSGGITLIHPNCHVKVWMDTETQAVTICIVPKYGKFKKGWKMKKLEHGFYTTMIPTNDQPPKILQPRCRHDWQTCEISERRQSNWCPICCEWFKPSK